MRLFVVGEDKLCCAMGAKLARDVLGWELAQPAVDTQGVTKLRASINRYVQLARRHPVLCIADTDGGCALTLYGSWLPKRPPSQFQLRFAVPESESWIMADVESLADFMQISEALLPHSPETVSDPKRALLTLAKRSRRRDLRAEMVSQTDPSKIGSGYNAHLTGFVAARWKPRSAATRAPSLARAIARMVEWREAQA